MLNCETTKFQYFHQWWMVVDVGLKDPRSSMLLEMNPYWEDALTTKHPSVMGQP